MNNDDTTIPADDQFLAAMGMGDLPPEAKEKALGDILYNLNARIGERLADQFSEAQLDEVNALADNDDDQAALTEWLKKNVPNYGQILEEEAQKLRDETNSEVEAVLARKRAPQADELPTN